MANNYPFVANPNVILTTATYAMGDARYTSRLQVPSDQTDVITLAIHQFLASFSAAKKIAVSKSIEYDPANIPSADAAIEHRLKVLVKHADGSATQIEIPMLEPDAEASPDAIADGLIAAGYVNPITKSATIAVVETTRMAERRARGR